MATVKQVREGLASFIETTCGLECKPRMPDQVNPPMAAILPGTPFVKYGITMNPVMTPGHSPQVNSPVELNLVVLIMASRASSIERAQEQIDQYLGLEPADSVVSVPVALASDPTLGGLVEYCEPLIVAHYGPVEVAGQPYFSGRLNVSVSVAQDLGV